MGILGERKMKSFTISTDDRDYEVLQKTRTIGYPVKCEGCNKRIKKKMYFFETDAGEPYCLKCCQQ